MVNLNKETQVEKMSYGEFSEKMREFNTENGNTTKGNDKVLKGVIVFTEDSFNAPYTEIERSYRVTSDNKAYLPNMCSNSIFGNCLDGIDLGVRLDCYMCDGWKVDYCYIEDTREL